MPIPAKAIAPGSGTTITWALIVRSRVAEAPARLRLSENESVNCLENVPWPVGVNDSVNWLLVPPARRLLNVERPEAKPLP
jgi:hypothetical protein